VAGWTPVTRVERAVLRAADLTARSGLVANDAEGYRVWSCARTPGWTCGVRFYFDGPDADVQFNIGPELVRKRRAGRWVGQWQPTGRMAVRSAGPLGSAGYRRR
jgi:hypothetical protein